ncbi:VOC family protein [Staphylococcus epidermidis]|uniref:VOC family protein n=1 Tax=Staphylococcus epidermidis TaxID=1282 RepID=UPI002095A46C|nr:VOC family protein [Staphylococcus epidermidis]MCO6332919.1 VOC family protein [Staphylococcus epidermidis]MCO6338484.1 VOC family protein [Staphylococcus epidermidis]
MELYSMPMFNKFLVNDIEKSSEWYQENLDFKSIFKFKNEQNQILMEHLRLAKYQDLMLISGKQFEVGNAVYTNILVPNIRILKQRISSQYIVEDLEEKPWNSIEMTIKDLDNHLITLTQSNIKNEEFNALMQHTSKTF